MLEKCLINRGTKTLKEESQLHFRGNYMFEERKYLDR